MFFTLSRIKRGIREGDLLPLRHYLDTVDFTCVHTLELRDLYNNGYQANDANACAMIVNKVGIGAIQYADLPFLRRLIRAGVDPNARGAYKQNMITGAICWVRRSDLDGQLQIYKVIRELIELGTHIDIKCPRHPVPLELVLMDGLLRLCMLLIAYDPRQARLLSHLTTRRWCSDAAVYMTASWHTFKTQRAISLRGFALVTQRLHVPITAGIMNSIAYQLTHSMLEDLPLQVGI